MFTQSQKEFIANHRVGSGEIIIKTDHGVVSHGLCYIDALTGLVHNWNTGEPLVVSLGQDQPRNGLEQSIVQETP
jgi:hypothetical protein